MLAEEHELHAQQPKLFCQIEIVPLSELHTNPRVEENGYESARRDGLDVSRFMPSRFTRLHGDDLMLLEPQNSRPVNVHRDLRIDKHKTYQEKRMATDRIVDVFVASE